MSQFRNYPAREDGRCCDPSTDCAVAVHDAETLNRLAADVIAHSWTAVEQWALRRAATAAML